MPILARPLDYVLDPAKRSITLVLPPEQTTFDGHVLVANESLLTVRPTLPSTVGEVLAVTFGVSEIGKGEQENEPYTPQLRGYLTWGIGGVLFDACFDLLHGTQVAVVAESLDVKVDLGYNIPCWEENVCVACEPRFRVIAGVGYGVTGRNARLTETVHLEVGAICTIKIPNFAHDFSVEILDGPVQTVSVALLSWGSDRKTYVFEGGTDPKTFNLGRVVPLANGQQALEITNPSDTERMTVNVLFRLSL